MTLKRLLVGVALVSIWFDTRLLVGRIERIERRLGKCTPPP
jgi:hypothetical protein